jgi:hypothetical protein
VSDYRVYCFDGVDRVWAADWIQAATDAAAIDSARSITDAMKLEVWQDPRLVATFSRDGGAREA